jgi:deoxyxylulose-5-phosphate synthase
MMHGGAGQFIREAIEEDARVRGVVPPRVITLGIPSTYVAHGSADVILSALGLDAVGIADSVTASVARFGTTTAPAAADAPEVTLGERSVAQR